MYFFLYSVYHRFGLELILGYDLADQKIVAHIKSGQKWLK